MPACSKPRAWPPPPAHNSRVVSVPDANLLFGIIARAGEVRERNGGGWNGSPVGVTVVVFGKLAGALGPVLWSGGGRHHAVRKEIDKTVIAARAGGAFKNAADRRVVHGVLFLA